MKNKAFTLVELLCVIVIIAVISLITFPNVGEIISVSKASLKEVQINDIKKAAEKWSVDNAELLDKYHLNVSYLNVTSIQKLGYLEPDDIIDPETKNKMSGCVQIKYNHEIKQYNYEYYDDCDKIIEKTVKDEELGYITYTYENKKLVIDKANSKQLLPAGLEIVNKNIIYADGETNPGLYDIGDEYVFRGNVVNNYITLSDNSKWRIISIDKDDYSIKAISITSTSGSFDNSTIKFSESSSKGLLIDKVKNLKKVNNNSIWPVPVIANIGMSVSELNSIFSTNLSINPSKEDSNKPIYSEVGLITVKDYVNASTDLNCNSNFLSESCINNNYLKEMFKSGVWTMTNDGSQIWYISHPNGNLGLGSPSDIKSLYPVIYLSSSVYIENSDTATGSDTTDSTRYIIK